MMRYFLIGAAAMVVVLFAKQPANAEGCGYKAGNSRIVCLATNSSASANQTYTTPFLGTPKTVTLCIASLYPTSFVISASLDGANFFSERFVSPALTDPSQLAAFSVGTPGQCMALIPAPYIRVVVQLPATVTIHLMAAN